MKQGTEKLKYINDINNITTSGRTVIAIGKFDGVHRGHQALLSRVMEISRAESLISTVLTFSGQPVSLVKGIKTAVCMTGKERSAMIESFGIDQMVELTFDESLMNMSAEDFIDEILIGKLNAGAVVAGEDLSFGKNRRGNAGMLLEKAKEKGFICEIIPKVMDGDREISSTYVREEIRAGRMKKTAELLGFPYFISGTVKKDRRVGHTIGFPTLNLFPDEEKLLPPFGVYASETVFDNKKYVSITNIGTRPTYGLDKVCVETYILDYSGDLYGKDVRVDIMEFMRPEIKFESEDALKKQIARDTENRRSV